MESSQLPGERETERELGNFGIVWRKIFPLQKEGKSVSTFWENKIKKAQSTQLLIRPGL